MKPFPLEDELGLFEHLQRLEEKNICVVNTVMRDDDKLLILYRCPTCNREYLSTRDTDYDDTSEDFFRVLQSSDKLLARSRWRQYVKRKITKEFRNAGT